MNAFNARPLLSSVLVVLSALSFTGCSPSQGRTREPLEANDANDAYVAQYSPPVPASGFVYTANERGRSISVIDLSSGWVKTVATRIEPHNVQISPDGSLLLVVGGLPPKDDDAADGRDEIVAERGELLLFDTAAMSANGATRVKVGSAPAFVVLDQQARLAYVTDAMDNNLSVVDLRQKKIVNIIATGKMPNGLRVSPDGRELYVASVVGNSVSVIDLARLAEVARIPVGKAPVQIGFTPNGRRVYVSLRDEDSVAVIDTAQRKQIATVAVGRHPVQVFATPDGRYVYVANQGTEANRDGTVSVIDTADNRVVSTIAAGKGAHGIVVGDDGRRAFVANIAGDSVSVIDTATRVVTDTIKVGQGPNGITFRAASR
jgi:YVTN family beta-propeller protein